MTQILSHQQGDCKVVKLCFQKFDASMVDEFRRQLAEQVPQAGGRLALDISDVRFVDSSALGALVGLHKSQGGTRRITLLGTTPTVLGLLKLTRMDRVFDMRDTLNDVAA